MTLLSTQSERDMWVMTMERHAAVEMPPPGVSPNGPTYSGWPLSALYRAALAHLPPSRQLEALSEFVKKHDRAIANVAGIAGPSNHPIPHTLEEMLAMRMRWGKRGGPWAVGFADLCIKKVGDQVHVWVVTTDNKSVVLEDEGSLYPSDALITKLNMLKSGE